MGQDRARHLSAWFFTVAFELAAGIMGQQQEWTIVTILFWLGIASLVAGYFPDIKSRFQSGKILGWEFIKQAVVSFVMLCAVYFVTVIGATLIKQWTISSARLFEPESWALQNRTFVRETPTQLMQYFKTYTNVGAHKILNQYIGKWYAITGKVDDVQDYQSILSFKLSVIKNKPLVSLEKKQDEPLIMMKFEDKWDSEVEILNKGDRISAYCKIGPITFLINLDDCQLVRR